MVSILKFRERSKAVASAVPVAAAHQPEKAPRQAVVI